MRKDGKHSSGKNCNGFVNIWNMFRILNLPSLARARVAGGALRDLVWWTIQNVR